MTTLQCLTRALGGMSIWMAARTSRGGSSGGSTGGPALASARCDRRRGGGCSGCGRLGPTEWWRTAIVDYRINDAAYSVPTMTAQPPSSPAPADPGASAADGPIGIKSAASRCTAGSTDPMQAFDTDVNTAWMCVPAYGVPGTVLRVEFDNWYVVTGVSIVPGWNRVNPDGSDEWLKHKTAATVEYQFNDPDETRLTQQTKNLRDEVVTPVQPPVLASAMTITITEFGTPTGPVADTTTIPGQGGVIASDTPQDR